MDSGPLKSKISNLARRFTLMIFCPVSNFINWLTNLWLTDRILDTTAGPTCTIFGALTSTRLMVLFLSFRFNSETIVWTSGNSGIKEMSKNDKNK
jgi:hypothetical protein